MSFSVLSRLLAAAFILGLLGACAGRTLVPSPEAGARWQAQQTAVRAVQAWQLDGRIALKNGKEGFNAGLSWQESPAHYRFELTAALGASAARLSGDPQQALLELPDQPPLQGRDASLLLAEHFGWEIPVDALRWWVRGLPAPGQRAAELDAHGLPLRLTATGWQVRYLAWTELAREGQAPLVLPQKIEASNGALQLKLSIHDWQL